MLLKNKNRAAERWWDTWVAIFTISLVVMVAGRLWVTEWTGDLYIIVYLAFIAAVSGLALGASQFTPLVSFFISTYFGFFSIIWLLASTIPDDIPWRERILYHIWWRLRLSFEQFNTGQGVTDPILFLTIMAILIWIISSTAAFIIIRKSSAWPVLIPLGMVMLVISHYDQDLTRNTRFLMTFIFFTLIIVGRVNLLRSQKRWDQEGVQITSEDMSSLIQTLTIVAFVLVILAWLVPITPQQIDRYTQLWNTATERWGELRVRFGDILVLESPSDTQLESAFDETLKLGIGTPGDDKVVFTVEVDAAPPPGYRNYWFTRSYDTYKNGFWASAPGLSHNLYFPEDFNLSHFPLESLQPAEFTFTSETDRFANLFITGIPTWISRPVEITSQVVLIDTIGGAVEDIVGLVASPEMVLGESYQFETLASAPTASDLRATDVDYPDWLNRYLQLPADFSPEIIALAASITTKDQHPYDLAMDITRWLRINMEYARTIPDLSTETDPIEWFLFDGKTGFCNYYATAEVLMLRSLGVPARIAVGYASGEYNSTNKTYTVRSQDSHAWPEVYFIDYGWMAFEPTVSQPALIRPIGIDREAGELIPPERGDGPLLNDQFDDLLPEVEQPDVKDDHGLEDVFVEVPKRFEGVVVVWVMLAGFLLILIAGFILLQHPEWLKLEIDPLPVLIKNMLEKHGKRVPLWLERWSYLASMSAAERAYRNLGRSIKIMGQRLDSSHTPTERAQVLVELLPQATQPVMTIINEYHQDKYSTHLINPDVAKAAGSTVLSLALKARLKHIFGSH